MYFAILRTKKLKSANIIRAASNHNSRKAETLNADPTIKNMVLVDGGPNVYASVKKMIAESGAAVRKTSVLAQEVFLSVSPEFFWKADFQEEVPERDYKKVELWRKPSFEWLSETFGENIVDCRLHLDEMNPHIHAIVVPLTEDGRLSAYEIFSKQFLIDMQNSYAAKLEPLGIVRGIPGSKAKHGKVKQFYQNITMAEKILQEIPKIPCPSPGMSEEQCQVFADDQNRFFQKILAPVVETATHSATAMKRMKAYQKKCAGLVKDYEKLREISRPPTIDFYYILEEFCLETEPQDPQWWVGGGHRIQVDFEKQEFLDGRNNFRGSGLIGLVKHLMNGRFADALHWIAVQKGVDEAHRCLNNEYIKQLPAEKNGHDLIFQLPEIQPQYRGELEAFLVQKGFEPSLTGPLLDQNKIYPSVVNGTLMAVFLCRNPYDPTGAELMGIDKEFSGMQVLSNRYAGAFSVGVYTTKRLVVCQDAFDALSYLQLRPNDKAMIVSSAGLTVIPPFVDELSEKGWEIQISFGNHDAGRAFAKGVQENYPSVDLVFPANDSWYADLIETHSGALTPNL
jgi:hypothetical protein